MFKTLLFSLYIAFALVAVFPTNVLPLQGMSLYAIFVLLSYLFLKQGRVIRQGKNEGGLMAVLFLLDFGLLLSHLVYFSGPEIIAKIPAPFSLAITNQWAVVAWFTLPLIFLALFKEKKK